LRKSNKETFPPTKIAPALKKTTTMALLKGNANTNKYDVERGNTNFCTESAPSKRAL